jgi:hypothetical protein
MKTLGIKIKKSVGVGLILLGLSLSFYGLISWWSAESSLRPVYAPIPTDMGESSRLSFYIPTSYYYSFNITFKPVGPPERQDSVNAKNKTETIPCDITIILKRKGEKVLERRIRFLQRSHTNVYGELGYRMFSEELPSGGTYDLIFENHSDLSSFHSTQPKLEVIINSSQAVTRLIVREVGTIVCLVMGAIGLLFLLLSIVP